MTRVPSPPAESKPGDSREYTRRREQFRRMLTVYGRKPALEALRDPALDCRTLHLASSNREDGLVKELRQLAVRRKIRIQEHNRVELSRISRNGKQDQGVALDILCPGFQSLGAYLRDLGDASASRLLALDGVTNPQNMGMSLRSARAAGLDGTLYADHGNPTLGPLVIKASAGTVYSAPIMRCDRIPGAARACHEAGFTLYTLEAGAEDSLFNTEFARRSLFILGGETQGVSAATKALPHTPLSIPMASGVESLNVAVSAALVAYASRLGNQRDR
ncbi:MAG: TrmH family RNA methyltransferase [Chromatocurvus sp.]